MPRLKGIGMPSKRKRKTAKLQEVPEPDADELDQGSACGPASPTHSSPPTVDSDEDLMPLERELATAEHDLALARAARWMRMADAKLKVAKRIYEAKMRRLEATADTGSVERLSRRLMTEFEWKGHQLIHSKSEKIALAKKAEAKDYKLRFLERENARLRRLLLHATHCELATGPNHTRKSPISMARADSPRAARRACSAHTPSPRLAPAPAAPHWSLAAASTRDGSATCSITPMRPPDAHPERPGVGCSQQQESQRDGPSSATDWLHPPLAVHMQNRNAPKIFCVAKANPEHGR